jgi:hypothetical protein
VEKREEEIREAGCEFIAGLDIRTEKLCDKISRLYGWVER